MFVLLVEHNPERQRTIGLALTSAGYHVESVESGGAALTALARPGPPGLILVEEHLPDMTALEFQDAVQRMSIPADLVVLGAAEEAAQWVDSSRRGIRDYVLIDPDGAYLLTLAARLDGIRDGKTHDDRARHLADALESTAAAVLIVDQGGHVEYANAASSRLLGTTQVALVRRSLTDLLRLDEEPRPRADLFAAMESGGEWAGEINIRRPDGEGIPCIATLSPVRRSGGTVDGLVLTLRDVSDRVAMEDALRAANSRLQEQAARDHLTGLYNRGYFREVLEREGARSMRYGDPLTVLMSDLDGFKAVNDTRGHDLGDRVIQDIAKALPQGVREGDVVGRYGGDEFCILLPNTTHEAAAIVAERLRSTVEGHPCGPDGSIRLTLSLGFATSPPLASDEGPVPASDLLRRADWGLLEAKRRGGNRVVSWREIQGRD